jgi:AraC family transcriptional regulator
MTAFYRQPQLIQLINQALDDIEAQLTEELNITQVAHRVGYSRCHFDRLFLAMLGETPVGYLRERRLSEAARALITSPASILDIALTYQFGSHEAFTRAFRRRFRLTPRAYRRRGCLRRYQARINLKRRTVLLPALPKLVIVRFRLSDFYRDDF